MKLIVQYIPRLIQPIKNIISNGLSLIIQARHSRENGNPTTVSIVQPHGSEYSTSLRG